MHLCRISDVSLVDSKINKQYLVFSLIAVVVIFIIANITDQEQFPLTEDRYLTDLLFDVTPLIVILL